MVKGDFTSLVAIQFSMFGEAVNAAYSRSLKADGSIAQLKYDLSTYKAQFSKFVTDLTNSYADKTNINDLKNRFIGNALRAAETVILEALTQKRKDALNKQKSVGVFATLTSKVRSNIGRRYEPAYFVKTSAKQFATLADLRTSYMKFKALNISEVDIINANSNQIVKSVSIESLNSHDIVALFHPNSNLRIQAHDSKAQH